MIVFKQKEFSEYDAMRQLYVELDRLGCFKNHKVEVISPSALIPVLRGNNIVIEKFTQATRVFGKDRYRMYIKVGAKAKMPDDVRLPQTSFDKSLGTLNLGLNFGFDVDKPDFGNKDNPNNQNQNQNNSNQVIQTNQSSTRRTTNSRNNKPNNRNKSRGGRGGVSQHNNSEIGNFPRFRQKEFGNNNKNKNNNNGGGKFFQVNFKPSVDFLKYQVHVLLGDALKYDKRDRSLVLEFDSIFNAIRALNILPFGIGYKIYLLNS